MQLALGDGSATDNSNDALGQVYDPKQKQDAVAYVKAKWEAKKGPRWHLKQFKRGPGLTEKGEHNGKFSMAVWELCLQIMLLDISHESAAVVYRTMLSAMPGADTMLEEWDYPEPAYFTEKLQQGRIICLLMNGFDLGTLTKGCGISGDGTSDIDKRRGIQDYFSLVFDMLDMDGERKSVAINGFINPFFTANFFHGHVF